MQQGLHKLRLVVLLPFFAIATTLHAQSDETPVTILALGDSLTAGYGLPPEDGLVPQLQGVLDAANSAISVVNAGVSGDTTGAALARFEWVLTPEVDAVIIALGGNDHLRGLSPDMTRDNLDQIVGIAKARNLQVLIVGMTAPGNFGSAYKETFDAIYPDLADTYDALFYAEFFQGIAKVASLEEAITQLMQADGLHPNSEGIAIIAKDLAPLVVDLANRAREADPEG